ncbi:MAG: hypothetical protein ABFS56_35135 [Pseudomonadota bacterium]
MKSSDPVRVEVSGGVDSPEMSSVEIKLAKDRYQRGSHFEAQLTEELAWGMIYMRRFCCRMETFLL